MKFFLDTANIEQIKYFADMGLVDGVTTNPSLIAKERKDFEETIKQITSIVDGPISAEVTAIDADSMVKQAKELAKIHNNIVVKIPMIKEGIKATNILSKEGININMTLIFSPVQALLAAKAGAKYVSPFVGRLDDISHIGMELPETIREIFDNYDYTCEIIVASIRNPLHVIEAARMGADIATIPPKVMEQMFKHPLTDIGLEKFMSDWNKTFGK